MGVTSALISVFFLTISFNNIYIFFLAVEPFGFLQVRMCEGAHEVIPGDQVSKPSLTPVTCPGGRYRPEASDTSAASNYFLFFSLKLIVCCIHIMA